MLGNMLHAQHLEVWMVLGVGTHQKLINVSQLYETLGSHVSAALPAFHAFTGCDFNPSFFRKGKKRPFDLMKKSEDFVEAFGHLSSLSLLDDSYEVFGILEEFTCQMYGGKKVTRVNDLRTEIFSKSYKFNEPSDLQKVNITQFDASNLPPCQTELKQHLLRSSYISYLWMGAHLKEPTNLAPLDNGWGLIENKICFKWFDGPQFPESIDDIVTDLESNPSEEIVIEPDMEMIRYESDGEEDREELEEGSDFEDHHNVALLDYSASSTSSSDDSFIEEE